MADFITQIKDQRNNKVYDFHDSEFIVDTRTAASEAFTGLSTAPALFDGMQITYWLNYGGKSSTSATLNLTLADGTTTGAIPCYYGGTTRLTTHYTAGNVIHFTYRENVTIGSTTIAQGWWADANYDTNSNTIGYQLRTNSTVMTATDTARYYKIYFTSADGNQWVPASANTTNNTTSARPVNQRPINPFGRIVYTSSNNQWAAGADITATAIWDQYTLYLGYSFNRTGSALTLTTKKPVYVKCAPQSDGSAIMDADTPIVQDLPTAFDGKIYIFLGIAYSDTQIELFINHPVYYHNGVGIRIWTGDFPDSEYPLTWDGVNSLTPYKYKTRYANETVVGGTIAWNQLIGYNTMEANKTEAGITFTKNTNGSLKISGTKTSNANTYYLLTSSTLLSGHKYFINGANTTNANVGGATGGYNIFCRYTGGGVSFAKQYSNPTIIAPSTSSATTFGLEIQVGYMSAGNTFNDTLYPVCIDLTLLFGATVADYIYDLEQSNNGAGVAWFREKFPKRYYDYNTGKLLSVNTSQHKVTGFNQWDEDWESGKLNYQTGVLVDDANYIRSKNYIPLIGGVEYNFTNSYYQDMDVSSGADAVVLFDKDKNYIDYYKFYDRQVTMPAATAYAKLYIKSTSYSSGVCINISDAMRNGQYVPYEEHEYQLDSSLTLMGIPKLDNNNDLIYDGDIYESNGRVTRKYGIVDLGTLTWSYASATNRFIAPLAAAYNSGSYTSTTIIPNIICPKYITVNNNAAYTGSVDKSIGLPYYNASAQINVTDSSYTSAAAFKTAMSGVYLVYELKTESTETANPYANPQKFISGGTSEYIDYAYTQGQRDVSVPVGHTTRFLTDYAPSGSSDIPEPPTTNGTYVLKAKVVNGSITYSWTSLTVEG